MGPLAKFLLALTNLVRSGGIKKIPDAIKFAKQEFGEVTPLLRKQIERVFDKVKKPVVGKPGKKEGTVLPMVKEGTKKSEGIETLEDSSPLMDRLNKKVEEINSQEKELEQLSDQEIKNLFQEIKHRTKDEEVYELEVDAFALIREAAKRTLGQRHYDVQLFGGMVLLRNKIAEMKTLIHSCRLMVLDASKELGIERSVSEKASMCKYFVSETYVKICEMAMQIHGGNGYMEEYGIERCLRDAHASTIYSGTTEIQKNIIAKWNGL